MSSTSVRGEAMRKLLGSRSLVCVLVLMCLLLAPQTLQATYQSDPHGGQAPERQPFHSKLVVLDAADLSSCTVSITHLIIKAAVTVENLKNAPDMSSVEICDLIGWDVCEDVVKVVALRMPRLEYLAIERCTVLNGEGLSPLEALENLHCLHIAKLAHPEQDYVPALKKLAALELEELYLDGSGLSLSGVQQLGELPLQSLSLLNLSALSAKDLEELDTGKFSIHLKDLHFYGLATLPNNLDWLLPLRKRLRSIGITGSGSWAEGSLSVLDTFSASLWTLSNVTEVSGAPVAFGNLPEASVSLKIIGDSGMFVSDWRALIRSKAIGDLFIVSCKSVTAWTLAEMLKVSTVSSPETIHIEQCPHITVRCLAELHDEWGKERILLIE
jgi:hypothetical protein